MCENTYEPNQFGYVVYMDDSGVFGNPDADARLDYYGMNNFPDLYFDGITRVSGVGPDYEDGHAYVPIIEDHFNDVTPVAVRVVSYNYVSGNAEVTVEVAIIGGDLASIDDTYLRVAVMEDGLQHWGYTFDHVVRTMIPDAQGTPLMVQHDGEVQRVTLPFALADMDPDELRVVAWVQRDTDRYVYNSANTRDFPHSASLTVTGQRQVLTAGGTVAFGVTTITNSGLEDDVFDLELDTSGLPESWNAYFEHDGIEGTNATVALASLEETQLDVVMEVASAEHGRVTLTVYSQAAGVEVGAVDFMVLPTGRTVLLVADDGIDDEIGELLGAAITASGRTMATWDRDVSAIDAMTLGDFDGVVWACGNANPGVAEIDRTALDAYLEDGGRLLVSGQDVAEDLVAAGSLGGSLAADAITVRSRGG